MPSREQLRPEHPPSKIRHILAISSGKGGVGKSTVASNISIALARTGAAVGLVDCDMYGPNIPRMMGISQKPLVKSGKVVPINRHGIRTMSIGYLIDQDQPVIWRGPMLHKGIQQFISDVLWEELDYLIVDMPPGTGDVQLSLVQIAPLTGAVVVTTPQLISVDDVSKAVKMFQQVQVEVLGVVENMVGDIFGSGGGERLAKKFGFPVLGRIPLDKNVRLGGDSGEPIVVSQPNSEAAKSFFEIANQLARRVSIKTSPTSLPIIE